MDIRVRGKYYKRSSKSDKGPPGEAELLKLNPDRRKGILAATGWTDLFPGTMNLKVPHEKVVALDEMQPVFSEGPQKYPDKKYDKLAKKRGGYLYYDCTVKANGTKFQALARRAVNPLNGVLEIVAPEQLCEAMHIEDGAKVKVKIKGTPRGIKGAAFYDYDGRPVNVNGMYQGGHAFLVCSGPSVSKLRLGRLNFVWWMGVNNSPRGVMPASRPNAWTCVDGPDKFLHTIWQDPKTLKIVPHEHRNKRLWNNDIGDEAGVKVRDCPNAMYINRNNHFNADRFLHEPTFNWGNSKHFKDANGKGGGRSVMLPALKILYVLGFRHVYLLGADFNMTEEVKYSFPQDRKKSSIKCNNATYKQLNWRYKKLRPIFDAAGFKVYNCNPESKLKAFPHISFDDAIAAALAHTDNWRDYMNGRTESTDRLYETKWYVCPECKKNLRYSKQDIKDGKGKCACGFTLTEKNREKYLRDKANRGLRS